MISPILIPFISAINASPFSPLINASTNKNLFIYTVLSYNNIFLYIVQLYIYYIYYIYNILLTSADFVMFKLSPIFPSSLVQNSNKLLSTFNILTSIQSN